MQFLMWSSCQLHVVCFLILCRCLASEDIVMLDITLCVCVSAALVLAAKVMRCIQCSLVQFCVEP